MIEAYRLLIGSIGDDSHSIGMKLLEIAFRESGFYVENIGILNQLKDFFLRKDQFDAFFISCNNGHADLFLKDFPYLMRQFKCPDDEDNKVWYLGGNLSVQESEDSVISKYRRFGFDFVAPKPISIQIIKENLYRDFYKKGINKRPVKSLEPLSSFTVSDLESVNDDPIDDADFFAAREQVLDSWPTGNEVRDCDIAGNHCFPNKNFHQVILNHHADGGIPLVQPRTGVSHTEDEIEILLGLRKSGLDISSVQLDAASRKNMYDMAQEGVMRTAKGDTSFLNGYPVPVHGVKGIETILNRIDTPFQIRAGSPDHRLVYEIGLAGGTTSVEGGFLCYLFPYDKHTSPVANLQYWKYVDRLAHWYNQKYDVIINREYFGPLTCCLVEPVIPICINIIQALLSARSGVKCISVGLAEQGNRSQDIAAINVIDKMTRHYLAITGYADVTISTVFHQFMAAFPGDITKAQELIMESSITGTLAKASRIMTKTPVESHHIPTQKDNDEGLRLTHLGINKAADVQVNLEQIDMEIRLLEREVSSVMKKIETLGQGSWARGAIKAFEKGILDIPFSPSVFNKNKLLGARDINGAIRFINPELMPFDNDIIDFHKEKIHQRMTNERLNKVSEILEKDLTRIWKNDYLKWPLDGHYIY
jgi:methylaspartate mutase E subunit